MRSKKPYVAPTVIKHNSVLGFSEQKRNLSRTQPRESQVGQFSQTIVGDDYVALIDLDRRYVRVSAEFCRLVGYDRGDLIGTRYDDLSAPDTNDIPTVFNMFCQLEYMHGLWMLLTRSGTHVLVRYESWLRPDQLIEAHMELVGAGYQS